MPKAWVYNGASVEAVTAEGSFYGATTRGITVEGWWNGAAIEPLADDVSAPVVADPLPTTRTEAFLTQRDVAEATAIFSTASVARGAAPLFGGPSGVWDREISFVAVTKRNGLWHAHYYGLDTTPADYTCYALSSDGETFTRPNIGRVSYGGSTNNNIVQAGIFTSSIYDEELGQWVLLREPNVYIYTSATPEGPYTQQKLLGVTGEHIEAKEINRLPDGRWAVYYSHGHSLPTGRRLRVFTSDTMSLSGTWTDQGEVAAFTPTSATHQFYGIGIQRVGDTYAGFVMVYDVSTELIWLDLYASNDGLSWSLVEAEWMPLGAAGSWDDAMLINGSTLVENGDQWEFFYTGSPLGHDAAIPRNMRIGKATLRRGGIIQAQGPGTITTTPLSPQAGAILTVNADGAGGAVTVEVLDLGGSPLPGYGATLSTDNLAHAVTIPTRPITLRFTLDAGAVLHGYAVR